jgi:hypothetical protein
VRAPKQARTGAAGEPAPEDPTPAKAAAGRNQQKRDPTKGLLDQGVTTEYPLSTLANPLCEPLIRLEARGLHPRESSGGGISHRSHQLGCGGEHASETLYANL